MLAYRLPVRPAYGSSLHDHRRRPRLQAGRLRPHVQRSCPPPRIFAFALVAVLLSGCSERESGPVNPEAGGPEEGLVRRLQLATQQEVILTILVNGQTPTSQQAEDMSGVFKPVSDWRLFDGNADDKVIQRFGSSASISAEINSGGTGGAGDSFLEDVNDPDLFNGVYDFTLSGLDAGCTVRIGFSGLDESSGNGNFLDVMAGDQNLNCDINTIANPNSCSCSVEEANPGDLKLPTPSNQLSLTVTPTDNWFFEGDPVDFTVTAGSGGISGTPRFAWYVCQRTNKSVSCLPSNDTFDFASGANLGTSTFSTSTSFTETFSVPGPDFEGFDGIVIGYAGDPGADGVGSYYAASNEFTFDILSDEELNSDVFGHNLPSTITEGTWIATNITMRNLGATSWNGSSYSVKRTAGPFIPSSVSMTEGPVGTMETYTFNFNMSTEPFEPLAGSWYDHNWSMADGGVVFGEELEWQTFVKEESGSAFRLDASPLWAWLSPDELHASMAVPEAQEEVLQRVRVEDYRLPRERVQADGRYVLRYEASLGETEWDADFSFLVEYDPPVFEAGDLERGRRGGTHLIQVADNTPGRLKVEGTRLPGRALSGEGLIFEIPLILRDGAEASESLALVEVVVTR